MDSGDTSPVILHSSTRAAISAVLAVTLFALLWDVSKPLLAAITFFGSVALFVSEFGNSRTRIGRYVAKASTALMFVLCAYAVVITVYPQFALSSTTVASWLVSHGVGWLALFSLAPKWRERFIGALMLYALIVVWTSGVPIFKRLHEQAVERATSPTVRVTLPLTIEVPRAMVTGGGRRVEWRRVILWTIIFTSMAALAFHGGLVKTSALFIFLALLMLFVSLFIVWNTHRRKKMKTPIEPAR